jgi:Abnormal spindle-like microcephaly-assoc'd, ASPM-SPD-2-Hydin
MSFNVSRPTPLFVIFLVVLVAISTAVNAQTNPSVLNRIDFGTVGRGGSAERNVILTNTANNSTLAYSVTFTNAANASGQLTASPSSGSIAPKSNITITVRLDVPSDAKAGNFSSRMVVNSTAQNAEGGTTVLRALTTNVTYSVQGNAPASAPSAINVPLVAGVLSVFALIAIGAVYAILRRT